MKLFVNKEIFATDIKIASGFLEKLSGIIGQNSPVLLKNTNSIHTFFLQKNLNIYFLDKNGTVIKTYEDFPPNKIIFPVKNAVCVLECYSTKENSGKIKSGDKTEITE